MTTTKPTSISGMAHALWQATVAALALSRAPSVAAAPVPLDRRDVFVPAAHAHLSAQLGEAVPPRAPARPDQRFLADAHAQGLEVRLAFLRAIGRWEEMGALLARIHKILAQSIGDGTQLSDPRAAVAGQVATAAVEAMRDEVARARMLIRHSTGTPDKTLRRLAGYAGLTGHSLRRAEDSFAVLLTLPDLGLDGAPGEALGQALEDLKALLARGR